jgi:hypothetical protein
VTDEAPQTEQPTPEAAPPAPQPVKLTAAEQRANATRTNAYLDMAKAASALMRQALSVCEMQMPNGGKLYVPASPADLMQIIESQEQRLKQMQIALDVLTEMILTSELVSAFENPQWNKDDPTSPQRLLKSAEITRENFWLLCARAAEGTASVLTRGLLSQGAQGVGGAVGGILRKQ